MHQLGKGLTTFFFDDTTVFTLIDFLAKVRSPVSITQFKDGRKGSVEFEGAFSVAKVNEPIHRVKYQRVFEKFLGETEKYFLSSGEQLRDLLESLRAKNNKILTDF